MLLISERKLSQQEINNYRSKGYRIAYGYENPTIYKEESVGYILETMYATSIQNIAYLLATHHKVTIKLDDQVYKLQNIDSWRYKNYKHPVLVEYERRKELYYEEQNKIQKQKELETLPSSEVPEDLDQILKAFAYLYQIDVDYTSLFSQLAAYTSIKYYLEHDIEYVNEVPGTSIDEESLFASEKWNGIEVITIGDTTLLEDYAYKKGA